MRMRATPSAQEFTLNHTGMRVLMLTLLVAGASSVPAVRKMNADQLHDLELKLDKDTVTKGVAGGLVGAAIGAIAGSTTMGLSNAQPDVEDGMTHIWAGAVAGAIGAVEASLHKKHTPPPAAATASSATENSTLVQLPAETQTQTHEKPTSEDRMDWLKDGSSVGMVAGIIGGSMGHIMSGSSDEGGSSASSSSSSRGAAEDNSKGGGGGGRGAGGSLTMSGQVPILHSAVAGAMGGGVAAYLAPELGIVGELLGNSVSSLSASIGSIKHAIATRDCRVVDQEQCDMFLKGSVFVPCEPSIKQNSGCQCDAAAATSTFNGKTFLMMTRHRRLHKFEKNKLCSEDYVNTGLELLRVKPGSEPLSWEMTTCTDPNEPFTWVDVPEDQIAMGFSRVPQDLVMNSCTDVPVVSAGKKPKDLEYWIMTYPTGKILDHPPDDGKQSFVDVEKKNFEPGEEVKSWGDNIYIKGLAKFCSAKKVLEEVDPEEEGHDLEPDVAGYVIEGADPDCCSYLQAVPEMFSRFEEALRGEGGVHFHPDWELSLMMSNILSTSVPLSLKGPQVLDACGVQPKSLVQSIIDFFKRMAHRS